MVFHGAELQEQKVIKVFLVTVTPEIAKAMRASGGNYRKDKPTRIPGYARQMKAGKWLPWPSLDFDYEGHLLNGFNRLAAVILANTSVDFYVAIGVKPETSRVYDTPIVRTAKDVLMGEGCCADNVPLRAAIERGILCSPTFSTKMLTAPEYPAAYPMFSDCIDVALKVLANQVKFRAAVYVAWCKAFLALPEKRDELIEAAGRVVNMDFRRNQDESLRTLRKWIDSQQDGRCRGSADMHEAYGKTCRALKAWLNGEQSSKLYAPSEDVFPLPQNIAGRLKRLGMGQEPTPKAKVQSIISGNLGVE